MRSDSSHHRRLLFKKWSRTIHIYISMLGLLAVIFFSVTGIMLNHEEWFGFATPHIVKKEGAMSEAMARTPDKLAIVEKLRKDFGATGAMDSFEVEDDRLTISFKSPGRHTDVTIQRADGHAEVVAGIVRVQWALRGSSPRDGCRAGVALHHRCDCGAVAGHMRDGLLLWCLVPKWRPLGLAAMAVCCVLCAVIYFVLVP